MGIVAKHLQDSCSEKQTVLFTLPKMKIWRIQYQMEELNIDIW